MENLKKLFDSLDKIGWGDPKEYNGTVEDIVAAHNILTGDGHLAVVGKRSNHNLEFGDDALDYSTWLKQLKESEGDTYLGYMFKKFPFKRGEFILHITLDELDDLAKKRLSFIK